MRNKAEIRFFYNKTHSRWYRCDRFYFPSVQWFYLRVMKASNYQFRVTHNDRAIIEKVKNGQKIHLKEGVIDIPQPSTDHSIRSFKI